MNKHEPNHEEVIRREAYLLSERAGHPAGMEADFWREAERLVGSIAGKLAPVAPASGSVAAKPARVRKSAGKSEVVQPPAAPAVRSRKAPARKSIAPKPALVETETLTGKPRRSVTMTRGSKK